MKKIFNIIAIAASVLAAVSCTQKEEPFTPGEPDEQGCYGVYFPSQDLSAYKELDPADPTVLSITAARKVTTGDIVVPVEVVDQAGVFQVSPLEFVDGQSEATIEVNFPNAEVGTGYTATIQISDPAYVSKYGKNATSIDFSVKREKWNFLGTSKWYDAFIGTFFGVPEGVYWELDTYENDSQPGLYRIEDPYGEKSPFNEPGDWDPDMEVWVVLNATNPNAVYITPTITSCDWGYGNFIIASVGGLYISNKGMSVAEAAAAGAAFGTLENGVVKMSKGECLCGMANYNNGGLYTASWDFKLVLPGGVDVDYSFEIEAGLTRNGILPVTVSAGTDIAKVRYEAYKGELKESEIKTQTAALSAGATENSVDSAIEDATTTFGIKLEETGIYTIVAVAFDATGTVQASSAINAKFVANEDIEEKAVKLHLGVGSAERYPGVNTDTAVEFWTFADSSDIVSMKIAAFSAIDLADPQSCMTALSAQKAIPDSLVNIVNTKGLSGTLGGLLPGTEYYVMIWASNGYEASFFLSDNSQFTTGEPKNIYRKFTVESYADDFYPESKAAFVGKNFNLYAVDLMGRTGMREYIGAASIADSTTPTSEPDEYGCCDEYVIVNGLGGPVFKKAGVPDGIEFDLYDGLLYVYGEETVSGIPIFPFSAGAGDILNGSPMYTGYFIPVLDGYYAYVSQYSYLNTYNFTGFGFVSGGQLACAYCDYLLVDPAKDDNGLAPAAAKSSAQPGCVSLKIENDIRKAITAEKERRSHNSASKVVAYGKINLSSEAASSVCSVSADMVKLDDATSSRDVKVLKNNNGKAVLR